MHVTWHKYNEKTPEQRQNALRFIYNFLLFKSRHCRHIVACICCCQLVCFCELWHLQFLLLSSDQFTKLIKRQWQKSLFACGCRCCSFFWRRGAGGGGNDFTVRASILLYLTILLHLINFIASRHHFFTLLSGWYLTCNT